ncbi:MAG: YbaB/EbfC family nucleoid-associated protein [Alphaproteobacteria bacterium]|nr:YbaB/EbfC family nucleoid-associated protein [Alphaproteobacteria bacterium]
MNNFNQLLKQAQQMQSKLMEAQKEMENLEIDGTSGGGMVSIVINGKGDIKKLQIDPKLMVPDEADIVSDLVIAAYNDAKSKLETTISANMSNLLPPGMKLPF